MTSIWRAGRARAKGNKVLDSDPGQAVTYFLQALEHAPERGSVRFGVRYCLVEAYVSLGRFGEAVAVLEEVVESANEDRRLPAHQGGSYRMGSEGITAEDAWLEALEEIADLHGEAGDDEAQLEALERVALACQETTKLKRRASSLRELATAQDRSGAGEAARATIELAIAEAVRTNDGLSHAEALVVEAVFLWDDGEQDAANIRLEMAREIFTKAADTGGRAHVEGQLGVFAWKEGELQSAAAHFDHAADLSRAAGSEPGVERAQRWLERVQERLDGDRSGE